jgi:hypothetical protein
MPRPAAFCHHRYSELTPHFVSYSYKRKKQFQVCNAALKFFLTAWAIVN